eukprot:12767982-Prorocentrum_lima.AAC.1
MEAWEGLPHQCQQHQQPPAGAPRQTDWALLNVRLLRHQLVGVRPSKVLSLLSYGSNFFASFLDQSTVCKVYHGLQAAVYRRRGQGE